MTVDGEKKLVSFHEMSNGRRHFTGKKKHFILIFWKFSIVESHN